MQRSDTYGASVHFADISVAHGCPIRRPTGGLFGTSSSDSSLWLAQKPKNVRTPMISGVLARLAEIRPEDQTMDSNRRSPSWPGTSLAGTAGEKW